MALHPPPPNPTMPQVQDDFYAMNMNNEGLLLQPFDGSALRNWDFNFAMDPSFTNETSGQVPMDIEAWSSVTFSA